MAPSAEEIVDVIAGELQLDRARLTPEATLSTLDIASLDLVAVQLALEQRFDIALEQADLHGVMTLGQIIGLVQQKASSYRETPRP